MWQTARSSSTRYTHSFNHSINQASKHSIKHSIIHPLNQALNQALTHSINQSLNHSLHNQALIHSLGRPWTMDETNGRSVYTPVEGLVCKAVVACDYERLPIT